MLKSCRIYPSSPLCLYDFAAILPPMKILCCGFFPTLQRTLEYKSFRPGEVNRAATHSTPASGKATNAARVLSQLGAEPTLLSFIGGRTGETVRDFLDQEPFSCRLIETKVPTRVCQTLLSADSDSCTELVEESLPLTAGEWKRFVTAFAEIQADVDRIIFSGNLPPHAPQDIYAELIAQTDGSKVLIDSSKAPLLATLEHGPALVKLNAEELGMTVKDSTDVVEQARELIARGAGAVGITAGKNSAALVTSSDVLTYSIPVINAVNPIGSGDSVNAGTAYALAKGSPLPEAFAFGLACGTSNAMNLVPGHVELDQIAELVPQIAIS